MSIYIVIALVQTLSMLLGWVVCHIKHTIKELLANIKE